MNQTDGLRTRANFFWSRLSNGILLATLASSAVAILWWALVSDRTEEETRQRNGGLVLDEKSLDFGEVVARPDFPWTVTLRNPTGNSVAVMDLMSSCSCTLITPRSFVVPSGGQQEVQLHFNLSDWGKSSVMAVRDFQAHLLPRFPTETSDVGGWHIKGHVRYPLILMPPLINFGDLDADQLGSARATVMVGSAEPLADLMAECESRVVSVNVRPKAESPKAVGAVVQSTSLGDVKSAFGRDARGTPSPKSEQETPLVDGGLSGVKAVPHQFEIAVLLKEGLLEGPFRFDINVKGIGADRKALPEMPLRVVGVLLPRVRSVPRELVLGTSTPGSIVEQTLELVGAQGDAFMVTAVKPGPNVLRVEPSTTTRAAKHTFRISYKYGDDREQRSQVQFAIRAEDGKSRLVDVGILAHVIDRRDVVHLPPSAQTTKP